MKRAAILGCLVALIACSAPEEPNPPYDRTPREYTLALGNSLVFGLQPGKDATDAGSFNSGLATVFVARLNATRQHPPATEINLACPGETTESFVNGGCFWTDRAGFPLHRSYQSSQLAAAEDFLGRHPGQINPILLSLGINEVFLRYLVDCNLDVSCAEEGLPGAADRVAANYQVMLSRLRAQAPDAMILLLVEYQIPRGPAVLNAALEEIYRRVRTAGRTHGAILVEADPIVQSDLCGYTFTCTDGDLHPTDAGYRALAEALWEASGFGD
jgi:lysophospholipase L1-like esterase